MERSMKKLLEIETKDEKRRSQLTLYIFNTLFFTLFILVRTTLMRVFEFSFFVELIFVVAIMRFYARAHRNKNYALWGFSAVMGMYLILRILHFTFIHYDIFVLYIGFLAIVFLCINSYLLGSPLYFPRIQWWEYDFRYRGELKANGFRVDKKFEVRLADLRRNCMSFLSFEKIGLGETVSLDIPLGKHTYTAKGKLKTAREDIPGRPIRYGLVLQIDSEKEKKSLVDLKKMWKLHKSANIRRKFTDYKEANS